MSINSLADFLFVLFSSSMLKMAHATIVSRHTRKLLSRDSRSTCAFSSTQTPQTTVNLQVRAKCISESKWRNDAQSHRARVESLLSPGLLTQRITDQPNNLRIGRSLDPLHPIYNFLIEYYGIKGSKGVNRLLKWCPDPFYNHNKSDDDDDDIIQLNVPFSTESHDEITLQHPSNSFLSGVFLENASFDDINSGILHLRGATVIKESNSNNTQGILYSPQLYLGKKDADILLKRNNCNKTPRLPHKAASAFLWYRTLLRNTLESDPILYCHGMHEWAMLYNPKASSPPPPPSSKYQSHLSLRVPQQTINEQVERKGIRCTHIDALRFFAPEARKWNWYGSLDDLSSDERCVGVQAKSNVEKLLESNPRHENHASTPQLANTILSRTDQLHLEQKACLHANMDLFKIAWRLQPFISSKLIVGALKASLQARTLDVEASPYDVGCYVGLDWSRADEDHVNDDGMKKIQLGAIKIETEDGRKEYQQRQIQVMKRGEVVRIKLLSAYNDFLKGVFDVDEGETGQFYSAERGKIVATKANSTI